MLVGAFFPVSGALSQEADPVSEKIEEAPVVWSETDTRLANHYIQLLQKEPAYGNVLDLLWGLYDKKSQTPLLLSYFAKAAQGDVPVAVLIHAHLLRKNEQIDEAKEQYDAALDLLENNFHALKALAEIADLQKRDSKALSLYTRLAALPGMEPEERLLISLRKADLHRKLGQPDEAVKIWNELLESNPSNAKLRGEITSMLLEAGETESAISALSAQLDGKDPRRRLDALIELNRLYEFISDFGGAARTAREGMGLLHFRNHTYADLFSRLVRIHERFSKLDELEQELTGAAGSENPTEQALYDLAEYYRLTAAPLAEEAAVKRLVDALPNQVDYRIRLTDLQTRNDRYEEAAATLDEMLSEEREPPLYLILKRAEISLRGEDRGTAEQRLSEYLSENRVTDDELSEILDFARSNYLDGLVEKLLREESMIAGSGSRETNSPIELARFLHERGRKKQSVEVLEEYVEAAGESDLERGRRLQQIALVLRDIDEMEQALEAITEALALAPENDALLLARAEIYVEQKRIEEAIEQLELVHALRKGFDDKSEIDQRLFSLMRGHYATGKERKDRSAILGKVPMNNEQFRQQAIAASQIGRSGDEPPPPELLAYYDELKKTANQTKTTEARYRAAWWAFKLQDNRECYGQLQAANREAGSPVLEVEEMLLELAELNERPTMMVDHLTNLIEVDPENADEYRQKRAEMRFELGYEDEAVRELQSLAAKPEASLNTLATLARVYRRQGNTRKQTDVWRRAYRAANVFEKRRIIKQLSTVLIESGQPEEALKAQIELLEKEGDPVQRRKQLDTQLTLARSHFLLDWMLDRYRELSTRHPFDRFYPEALAMIHSAADHPEEAYEMMKKAYYMSSDNDSLLGELADLADRLGDLKSAIYYRRQLLAQGEGETLENWQTLVEMLEKDLRVDEANLIRRRLESKFGTDPEFLTGLAAFYEDSGHLRNAERTLEDLVELRGWDVKARFQLALIKTERGKKKEAFELFNAILKDTESVEIPPEFESPKLPILRTSTLDDDQKASPGMELDQFVLTAESFPFVGGNLQDEVIDRLQKTHPEFRYRPGKDYLIRIRSIEEAAALAADLGVAGTWLTDWRSGELPLTERLWAARYAEARSEFAALLNSFPDDPSHSVQTYLALAQLLAGDVANLEAWVEEEHSTEETQHSRAIYVQLGLMMLLANSADDPLLDHNALYAILESLPVSTTIAAHFFSELRKVGDYEEAFRVGDLLAEGVMNEHGSFRFALSQVAGWTGRAACRERHLEAAIDLMLYSDEQRTSDQLFTALTEKWSLLEDDTARGQWIDQLLYEGDFSERKAFGEIPERAVLIALAGGLDDLVIRDLGKLASRQVSFIRPRLTDEEQLRYSQSQSWQRMVQILRYYAARIDLDEDRVERFVEAVGGAPLAPPSQLSVVSDYEEFLMEKVCVELNWLPAPERRARVRQVHSLFLDEDSTLNFGKTLERHGFYREAIPIYRVEALQRDRDYAPLQGLFDSCLEALEPSIGLAVIEQINNREFPAPPGLTVDYLNDQHARFLLIARDEERLRQLSRFTGTADRPIPVTAKSHLPFQDALVELLRQRGANDSLLPLLQHMREHKTASDDQLLLGADLLMESGNLPEAETWLNSILSDGVEPEVERKVLRAVVEIHRRQGWPDKTRIISLARESLDRQPGAVNRELVGALREADANTEAVSILKLLHRKSSDPEFRTEVNLDLLASRLNGEENNEAIGERLEILFHQFQYDAGGQSSGRQNKFSEPGPTESNGYRVAKWFSEFAESERDPESVLESLNGLTSPRDSNWVKELCQGFLSGDLEGASIRVCADAEQPIRDQVLETLPGFGTEGIRVARTLVAGTAAPGTSFFPHEPVRQLSLFHRLGDRERFLEVYDQLVVESKSDLFHQNGLDSMYPSLMTRQAIPRLLESFGELDLAKRLYSEYHAVIQNYHWNHESFLEDYVRFLIETGDHREAELILQGVLRKSIRFDLRLLASLLESRGLLDDWEAETAPYFLSEGQKAALGDWCNRLAEGREMIEYRNSW